MKAILVVGGAGYIGSHTAKLLKKRGYLPVVLDNLSTGHRAAVQFGPFEQGSYGDIAFVESVLRKHKIDTVMHFGAKAQVGESVGNPLLYYRANAGDTFNLLTAMQNVGVRKFLFSSTCATFGEPEKMPIHERLPQTAVNPYGWSKLLVEQVLRDLDERRIIRSGILRYFNAAGADPDGELGEDHRPESHLIPLALAAVAGHGKKLTVFGNDYPTRDGSCVRDYIHINDLARAHLLAMELLNTTDTGFDVNLGTEKGSTVLEILEAIKRVTGREVPHEIGPRRAGDPQALIADSSKAHKLLKWKPQFTLDDTVKTAWNWFSKHPHGFGDDS